jgi:hypothetical protein
MDHDSRLRDDISGDPAVMLSESEASAFNTL